MAFNIELSAPQYSFSTARSDRNLFFSGQGGGKTHISGPLSYNLVSYLPNVIGLICANTYAQLSNSTLMGIFEVWESLGWKEYDKTGNPDGYYVIDKDPPTCFVPHGHTFKSNQNKIFLRNGAVIFTASLDNYKALDGMTIGWAILDETKDTREAAVKHVIIGRLRQRGMYLNKEFVPNKGIFQFTNDANKSAGDVNPLFIFTSPAKEQWINEMFDLDRWQNEIVGSIYSKTDYFHKRFDNKTVVICSAYHNEKFLPKNYIENKIKDLSPDLVGSLIYGDPFAKSGGEYYSSFKKSVHIKRCEYTPGLPLHLSFDFNVNPYMTGLVWQVVKSQNQNQNLSQNQMSESESDGRMKARCIREYAMSYPRNTIEDTCRQFLGEYGHLCDHGFYYYGDASGKNTQPYKEQRNHYDVIDKELREIAYSTSKRVLKSNPRHRSIMAGTLGRRDFMNAFLNGRYDVDVEIDESCKHLIADLEFMKEDANGAKDKLKAEINGVQCEKYGHHSDAMDAFVCYNWGDYRK